MRFETDAKRAHYVDQRGGKLVCPETSDTRFKAAFVHFVEANVEFQSREGNGVAYRVATKALSLLNYAPKLYSIVRYWVYDYVQVDKPVYFLCIG